MIEKISLQIGSPPEEVFDFLAEYQEHYTEVSPDHIERVVEVRDPDPEHPDVRFYFKQRSPVTGRVQKVRGKVTRVEMNKRIDTRFLFPVSLFLRGADNVVEPSEEGSILTVYLYFTPLARLAGNSTRKVVEHIAGELEEMKKSLESGT